MRRPSTCSETSSVSSGSTAYSITKETEPQPQPQPSQRLLEDKSKKRGLRQKARDMVHDMGKPPTARQDAKEGKRTLNYAPLGGMMGEPLTRPARV